MKHFKSILALISLFTVNATQANPITLEGSFYSNGQVEIVQALDNQVVYAFTDKGRQQLKNLKAQGYNCKLLPRQTYRCLKVDKKLTPSSQTLADFERTILSREISFLSDATGSNVISDGEVYKSYEVYQSVIINEEPFEKYIYSEAFYDQYSVKKISFKSKNGQNYEYQVVNGDTLTVYLQKGNKTDTGYIRFLASGDLKK